MAKKAATSGSDSPKTTRSRAPKAAAGEAPAAPRKKRDPDAPPMLALFHGDDAFRRQSETDKVRTEIEKRGPIETVRFDGATAQPADVFDECRTFGLMQQHKIVIVDEADAFVKGDERRPLIEKYAGNPSDNATLILRASTWYPGKLDKLIAEYGIVVKCDAMKPAEAVKWATQRVKSEHRASIEPEAAQMLVERLGTELGMLDSELGKLAAASAGETINAQLVREMVGLSREDKAWEIQAYLLRPDAHAALWKLHELLEVSRVDAVPIRWSYADLARKLHAAARALRAGANPGSLFSQLRLWGETGNAVLSIAKRVDPEHLADLLKATIDADVKAKSGVGDEVRGLEVLTLRFASLAQ